MSDLNILRRIAERGLRIAQSPPQKSTYVDLFQHILDEIERLKFNEGWISVNDYLPQQDFEVLVCECDDVFVAIFRESDGRFYFETADLIYEYIEYWMPLPPPPKEN